MALLAQNTFTIRRLAKDELNLVFSSDTLAIPSKNGVADLSTAEFRVKVTKGGRELFPVSDEEIGGRNLLEGNWDLTWEDSHSGYQYLLRPQIQSITDKVSIGDTLTFSFDVEAEADTSLRVYDSNGHPGISFGSQNINVKQGKQRVSFTKTLVAGSKNTDTWYMDVYNNNNGVKFSINKIKIEKDNKATPWTPAPEDILSNAILTAHNCTAVVDGDKIKLTSIEDGKDAGYVDVTVTYGEGNNVTRRFTWARAETGVSITNVDVEYAVNNNTSTAPTTGWSTLPPSSLSSGQQLWTRTVTSYSAGSPTYSVPANITPQVGQGVESVTEEFAISSSKTVQPTTGWSTTQPTWVQGQYIWSRVKVVYKNPASTVYTGYAVSSEWEAINELEIGGRNLLIQNRLQHGYINVGDGVSIGSGPDRHDPNYYLIPPNKNFITATVYSHLFVPTGGSGYIFFYDENKAYLGRDLGSYQWCSGGSSGTTKIGSTTIAIPSTAFYYRISTIHQDLVGKVEFGTKATDWTPAIEDTQFDYESKIKQAADSISLAVYNKTLDALNPATELKLTSSSIKLTVAGDIAAAKNEAISAAATDATTKANNAKSEAISAAASDATTKANNAKDQAISVAATDATNKVNGLKSDLSGTGIDIEAGILTLYSGVKGENPGGKIIIAGDNFSVDANGKLKAVDGEFSGKITANEGTLGNLTMQSGGAIYLPPTYSSQKGRLDNDGLSLIYDGANSQKIEWNTWLGSAGRITCNSQGRLRLSSSFGIELSVDFLSYSPISITGSGFTHSVNFGSAEVSNIRKLSSIGQLNMAYTTHALSADTWYHLSTDVTLIIITSAGSGSVGIYRITGPGNSTPSNGDIKIVTNATNDRTVYLKTTKPSGATYGSNIKVPTTYDGSDFNLHENSSIMLVYYGGYWRVQTDRGQ